MTRKDYIVIAKAIAEVYYAPYATPDDQHVVRQVISNLSREFALDNDRFEPGKFFDACTALTTSPLGV